MDFAPKICLGHVMHRRLRPARNAFVYPVFYVQLPLRGLTAASRGIFSVDRFNLLSFYTRDHGARDGSALLPWIEGMLAEHGLPHDGPVMLQTFPRVLGYVFNPVSFWYCHDRAGQLVAILAEVNNTFGGSRNYLLHRGGAPLANGQALHADKALHVSPFNRVEGSYRFRFSSTRNTQVARVDYDDGRGELLLTSVSGKAFPWSRRRLLFAFLRMPFLTLGITARIHWQALKLWRKGLPFHGTSPARSL